jgi:hypothetical protein
MGALQLRSNKIPQSGQTAVKNNSNIAIRKWTVLSVVAPVMFFLFTALSPMHAQAQRGISIPADATGQNSPSSGIPNLFDTATAKKNHIVADLPTFAVDYGLSERFTLGTNALSALSVFVWATSKNDVVAPVPVVKLRYKLINASNWAAAVTGYTAGTRLKTKAERSAETQQQTFFLSAGTLNVSHSFVSGSAGFSYLTGQFTATGGKQQDRSYSKILKTIHLPAIWWRYSFNSAVEHELLLTTCTSMSSLELNNSARIDTSEPCFGNRYIEPALRALIHWRSSDQWLWTAGAHWIPNWIQPVIPLAGITFTADIFSNQAESE